MRATALLLSLGLPLVLSFYQDHIEDLLHSSSGGVGPQPLPHPLQTSVKHHAKLHERYRRESNPMPIPQPQAQPHDSPALVKNDTFKVVCYFTNYAWYRSGIGKFRPRDIDPQLCTHVVYGFGVLDPQQLTIKPSENWADIENKLYEKATALKKRGVKVVIAIGGWDDSAGDKYSRMVNSPTSRRRFIEHFLQFTYQHNFDGLELDWEFPKCWQLNCSAGPDSDKEGFAALIRELREAFNPHGLLLSAAVTPIKQPVDIGYNVPLMSEKLDWISVKTYDYHGPWEKRTGHGAPLYSNPDDDDITFSANFTINYWMSKGADSRKLILGIPMFGKSFKLASNDNGLYAYSTGPGEEGEQTKVPGLLAYYEICDRIKSKGWEVVKDPKGAMGPYAWHGDQWVAFDDPSTVQRKSEYVMQNSLGGVMIFSLDHDDFRNHCGSGNYPLLRAVNTVLRNYQDHSSDNSLVFPEEHTTEKRTTEQHTTERQMVVQQTIEQQTKATSTPALSSSSKKVVCYFTNWAWYRNGLGKFLPNNIDTSLCSHIVYAFAILEPTSLTVRPKDKWADIDNDFYGQVTGLKQKGLKVLLGLGGWDDSKGDKYSRLVNSPDARARFVPHLSEFLRTHNFDGVNLQWEYPTCWQIDCSAGPASDKEGFAALVTELSLELNPRGLLMSALVSHNNMVIEKAYDVKTLIKHMDWLEVKAYDYRGSWDGRTGQGSSLYHTEGDITPYKNVNFSMHYWLAAGAPREKLVLGMPFYGQTFTLEDPSNAAVGAPSRGPGNAGPFTTSAGIMAFYEICEVVHREGWKIEKPADGTVAYHDTQWLSFDDVSDIRRKAEFINNFGLGGAMIWTLDFDDFNNNCGCGSYPLLNALNTGLRNPGTPHLSMGTEDNCTAHAPTKSQK